MSAGAHLSAISSSMEDRADDHGWSYADVFRGVEDGGASGTALPTAPADADQ